MGYGCIICDECLELPAPHYTSEDEATLENAGEGSSAWALRTWFGNAPSPRQRNMRAAIPTDVIVTPCGHLFHQTCISRWFKDKSSMNCPACRKLCNQSNLIRMFPTVVLYHPALDDDFNYKPPVNQSTETSLRTTDPFAVPILQAGPRTPRVEMQNPEVVPQNPRPHTSGHHLPTSTVTVPNESQVSLAPVPKPMTLDPFLVDCTMESIRNPALVVQTAGNDNLYNNLDNIDSDDDRDNDSDYDRYNYRDDHRDNDSDDHRDNDSDDHRDNDSDDHRDNDSDDHRDNYSYYHRDNDSDDHRDNYSYYHRDNDSDDHRDNDSDDHRDNDSDDQRDNGSEDVDEAPVFIRVNWQPALEQPRSLECARPTCQDLHIIHQTLIKDFEDVQTKYSDALDELAMKQAQEQSYDDMIKSNIDAIDSLRGERDELKEKLVESTNAINTVQLQLYNIQTGFNVLKRSTPGSTGIENEPEVPPTKRFRNNENEDNPPPNGKS